MADAPPPQKHLTKTFEVLVGKEPNQRRFTVYSNLAAQRSEFFNAARSSRWTEPSKPTILDEHNPAVFSAYLHCLCFGAPGLRDVAPASALEMHQSRSTTKEHGAGSNDRIKEGEGEIGGSHEDSSKHASCDNDAGCKDTECDAIEEPSDELYFRFLIDLYILTDKLMDPTTANLDIDEIDSSANERKVWCCRNQIKHIYRLTVDGSPLRKLVRHWYIHEIEWDWVETFEHVRYHVHFVQDVLREAWTLSKNNLDMPIKDVFANGYMRNLGTRDHQRIDNVAKHQGGTGSSDHSNDVAEDG